MGLSIQFYLAGLLAFIGYHTAMTNIKFNKEFSNSYGRAQACAIVSGVGSLLPALQYSFVHFMEGVYTCNIAISTIGILPTKKPL